MLPEDAIKIVITATVYDGEYTQKASKILNNREIQKAFNDAERNYIEDDDKFCLTDKGRKYLETILKEQ